MPRFSYAAEVGYHQKKWGYKCHCIPTRYFPGRKWLRSIKLRCPSPIFHIAVSFSADERRLVLVVLLSARCFTSELVHVSVDEQADGEEVFKTIVVSTFEAVTADTAETHCPIGRFVIFRN